MSRFLIFCIIVCITASCTKHNDPMIDDFPVTFLTGSGVFIINEGNFNWGNGSVSYYSYDSLKIYNDIFQSINGRPIGDVPNSMVIDEDKIYIVINNSGKIEVVEKSTFKSVRTITGLKSPRNISVVDDYKAYVTSLYSDSVTIISLADNTISGFINLRRTSESIVISGKKAFISNWVGGNEIMVVNTFNDKVIDSVEVGKEPESMVLDKNTVLWVLCNGGWAKENYAELVKVNVNTHEIINTFVFPSKLDSPLCLQADGNGDSLYYIDKGIRCMSIEAQTLPALPLIPESDHLFYKLGINPLNGDILATDAVDYQQKGFVLIHNRHGTLKSSSQAGIIPSFIYFKVQANPNTD
ncbi:MAG: YncE family protein [Bacteroidales bacterium]|nr:YncE family protein [Bacteroidales bacterium]